MKLATYQDGSRDGQLVVVSRDLGSAHYATGSASRLQQVLDDWNFLSPQLQDLYDSLNQGRARHAFPFDPAQCMAPLPRAYQVLRGGAYLGGLELACAARKESLPDALRRTPRMHYAAGDELLGPCDALRGLREKDGIDFEAALAVVTGDVAMGVAPSEALEGVRLLLLVNDWTLTEAAERERERGSGALNSRPATACAPVAVTPDELGEAWDHGRASLTVQCSLNGRRVGLCESGEDMHFHFGQLLAQAARTRRLRAGAIVSAGCIVNQDTARGYASITVRRNQEMVADGASSTPYLVQGDTVRIEARTRDGKSVFGAIEQAVAPADAA